MAELDAGSLGLPVFPWSLGAREFRSAFIAQYKEERPGGAGHGDTASVNDRGLQHAGEPPRRGSSCRNGTAVSAGGVQEPAWNPLVLLGLLPGDRLLEVGATRDPDAAAFRDRWRR